MSRCSVKMSSLPRPSLSSLNSARSRHAFKAASLESVAVVAHPPGLGEQFLQGRDFRAELVQFHRGRELVDELVALGVVQVVLVLLGVGQAALQLGQPPGALGGRQIFQLVQEVLLFFEPAADRFEDCHRRTGESALEDGAGEGDARLPAAAGLRQELVDVGGDRLVEVVLLRGSA